jgi:glycosyltransferase involved in cell wall biosynthesis
MSKILAIATAKLKPGQIEGSSNGQYPRVDYLELGRHLDIDILDYAAYDSSVMGAGLRYVETQLRSDLYLALLGFWASKRYRTVFAMSERAGIPFASLNRFSSGQPRFVNMFQSWSGRQEKAVRRFGLLANMDSIIVHCRSMRKQLEELGAPSDKIHLVHYSVDQKFFVPSEHIHPEPGLLVSIGEVRTRDYELLFRAIDGLVGNMVVIASGSWYAREKNRRLTTSQVPSNVEMSERLPPTQLRDLYARAQFVVVPVHDTVSSAGATVSLEAACMGRAVVAPRSRGLTDYIIDGETGILVEPGDAGAMRDAIRRLLANPEEARRLGANARQRVEEELNLDRYVERLASVLN